MDEVSPSMLPVDFDPFAEKPVATKVSLTDSQRELYAAVQMGAEASCAFNQCFVLRLRGPLSMQSLERALAVVVERHDALRARVVANGEEQEIAASVDIALPFVDFSELTERDRGTAVIQLLDRETRTPFELTSAPLWRAQVLRERADSHCLVFTAHHLVCDGWASAVLFGDLASAYAADRFGLPAKLAPAASYREFIESTRSASVVAEVNSAQAYWLQKYANGVPSMEFPLDHPRPALKTYKGARETLPIDEHLCGALKSMGAQRGCTLFVTLLAAFEALIARLSGSQEFVIGIPMASQALQDNGQLVAHGMNTIPLRCQVGLEQSFAEHLQATRGVFLDAQAHQRLTFGSLVQQLKLPHDPSRTPLVNVIFNIDRLGAPFDFGDVALVGIETPRSFVNFELSINAIDRGRDLLLECDYNTDLFAASTIVRWLGHFQTLLSGATANPATLVGMLPLLTDAQSAALLASAQGKASGPTDRRVHDLIEQQAKRASDAIALSVMRPDKVFRELTYAELDARANRLAHLLRKREIGRGAFVGLCVERSVDMVVSQLAILKAGAAYVPLDPAYPADRLAYMAQDAQLALLVTESSLVQALGWPREKSVLVDIDLPVIAAQPELVLAPDSKWDARPEDPAYVIYTSGSTGQPKGVVVPHRSVVNFLVSMAGEPGLTTSDRLVAVTTLSFDIAVLELLLPLSTGARIVLAVREQTLDGRLLRELLSSSQATVMQATPTTWRMLIDAGWQGSPTFKALIGGEGLPPDLAVKLLERTGQLWNMYGPTETTVWSSCWKVGALDQGISIGRPIGNTQIYILDEGRQLTPIGVPGEIYIGGGGVALGYLRRPELTAERFVDDPFHAGRKLYRTGDRGRWSSNGMLEHLGRLDFQVKIRGYRIELGEIESTLLSLPQVARAVTVLREDKPGDVRLVAYVVPRQGMPAVSELRDQLRAKLPDYMVPQHYIELASIPLLPNGKIDRTALPKPIQTASNQPTALIDAPSTAAERTMAEIWKRLLDVDQIGRSDNFFDLGGHSLLAIRAISEIEAKLGIRINVPRLLMESLAQIASGVVIPPASARPTTSKHKLWLERLTSVFRVGFLVCAFRWADVTEQAVLLIG